MSSVIKGDNKPFRLEMPKTGTLANSTDPDEVLHCLLRQNRSSEKEKQYYLKILKFTL